MATLLQRVRRLRQQGSSFYFEITVHEARPVRDSLALCCECFKTSLQHSITVSSKSKRERTNATPVAFSENGVVTWGKVLSFPATLYRLAAGTGTATTTTDSVANRDNGKHGNMPTKGRRAFAKKLFTFQIVSHGNVVCSADIDLAEFASTDASQTSEITCSFPCVYPSSSKRRKRNAAAGRRKARLQAKKQARKQQHGRGRTGGDVAEGKRGVGKDAENEQEERPPYLKLTISSKWIRDVDAAEIEAALLKRNRAVAARHVRHPSGSVPAGPPGIKRQVSIHRQASVGDGPVLRPVLRRVAREKAAAGEASTSMERHVESGGAYSREVSFSLPTQSQLRSVSGICGDSTGASVSPSTSSSDDDGDRVCDVDAVLDKKEAQVQEDTGAGASSYAQRGKNVKQKPRLVEVPGSLPSANALHLETKAERSLGTANGGRDCGTCTGVDAVVDSDNEDPVVVIEPKVPQIYSYDMTVDDVLTSSVFRVQSLDSAGISMKKSGLAPPPASARNAAGRSLSANVKKTLVNAVAAIKRPATVKGPQSASPSSPPLYASGDEDLAIAAFAASFEGVEESVEAVFAVASGDGGGAVSAAGSASRVSSHVHGDCGATAMGKGKRRRSSAANWSAKAFVRLSPEVGAGPPMRCGKSLLEEEQEEDRRTQAMVSDFVHARGNGCQDKSTASKKARYLPGMTAGQSGQQVTLLIGALLVKATQDNCPDSLFWNGIPVSAVVFARCFIHWNVLQPARSWILSEILTTLSATVEKTRFDNDRVACMLTTTVMFLHLIRAMSRALSPDRLPSEKSLGRMEHQDGSQDLVVGHITKPSRGASSQGAAAADEDGLEVVYDEWKAARDGGAARAAGPGDEAKQGVGHEDPLATAAALKGVSLDVCVWFMGQLERVATRLWHALFNNALQHILSLDVSAILGYESEKMLSSPTLDALIVQYGHVYSTLKRNCLFVSVRNQFVGALLKSLSGHLVNQVMRTPSLCTMACGVRLQVVCGTTEDWGYGAGGNALKAVCAESLCMLRQLSLLLLMDKRALQVKDIAVLCPALNEAQLGYILTSYDSNAAVNEQAALVAVEHLKRAIQRRTTTDRVPPTILAHYLNAQVSDDCAVLASVTAPRELDLRIRIGRFSLSDVPVPVALSVHRPLSFLKDSDSWIL